MKFLILIILHLYILSVFSSSAIHLYQYWKQDSESTYYLLIIVLAILFLYAKRLGGLNLRKKPSLTVLIAIIVISFALGLFNMADINVLEYLALLLILLLMQLALYPTRDALQLVPIVLLLAFVLPVWDYLDSILIAMAGVAVPLLLELTEISVNVDGHVIELSYGLIEIAGGCSGKNYLISSWLLAGFIILTSRVTWLQTLLILFVASIASVLFNWLRIFLIVLIADNSQMQSELVYDHATFGWLLYLSVICILAAIYFKLDSASIKPIGFFNKNQPVPWLNMILILVSVTLGATFVIMLPQNLSRPELSDLPPALATELDHASVASDDFKHAAEYVDHQQPEVKISRYVNWRQQSDEQLVPYIAELFNNHPWKIQEKRRFLIGEDSISYALEKNLLTDEQRVKCFWFAFDERILPAYSQAKLFQLLAVIKQQNNFSYYQALIDCDYDGCDDERAKALQSVDKIIAWIQQQNSTPAGEAR